MIMNGDDVALMTSSV